MLITLCRHGVTSWNQQGRVQGHTDIDLLPQSEQQLRQTRVHSHYHDALWFTSPLIRTLKTAEILNKNGALIEPLLMEMCWGDYEGLTRQQIREKMRSQNNIPKMQRKAPNGESPQMCCSRIEKWLNSLAQYDTSHVVAVTHKGIIRCALALACHWDMQEDFPIKLKWHLPHIFKLDAHGKLQLLKVNYDWQDSPLNLAHETNQLSHDHDNSQRPAVAARRL